MATRHFVIGTAGHIDHGKSSLVKALTGTDPDRLPEEKARGMTIDLGFAHLEIVDPNDPAQHSSLGIVDVPGHADFVKNMVAGTGGIDMALFVVAADDGWMPQSEEHLQILMYLGVRHAVIALTKSDLVDDPRAAVELLRESLEGTCFADAPIVPVAAPHGRGLDELRAAIATVLRDTPEPADIGKPRLPVDRAFSPPGIGTVVTGTLSGGVFHRGQETILQPSGTKTHLRNLQNHSSNVETARPGMRTALHLADVAVGGRDERDGVHRGDVVTIASLGGAADTLDVIFEKSARETPGLPLATRPLRNGQKVMWHHGGAAHEARVYFQGTRTLEPGARAAGQLRFHSPVFAFAGDRFVLRDFSRQATIAGGTVIDPDASRAHFRKARNRACLEACAAAPDHAEVLLAARLQRDPALPCAGLLRKSRFPQPTIDAAIEALVSRREAITASGWIIDAAWWARQLEKCGSHIRTHHRTHPQLMGMEFSEFTAWATALLPDKRLFDVLVTGLAAGGLVRSGRIIRWTDHRPSLPPALHAAGAKVRAALSANLIEPPNPGEVAPGPVDKQALKFLLDTGEAIQLDEKAVLLTEGYEKLKSQIVERLRKGQATASELRQITGTTRRVLIPLLERLDREGVTRRSGDFRTLK